MTDRPPTRNESIAEVMYLQRKDGLFQQIEDNTEVESVAGRTHVRLGKVTGLFKRIVVPPAPLTDDEDASEWEAAIKRQRADDVVMFMMGGKYGIPQFVYAEPVDVPFHEVPEGTGLSIPDIEMLIQKALLVFLKEDRPYPLEVELPGKGSAIIDSEGNVSLQLEESITFLRLSIHLVSEAKEENER